MKQTKTEMLEGITHLIFKSKIIANNTVEIQYQNGDRAIKLHNTDVVTFKANGDVILNSGGWKTPTTKDRINRFSPFNIYQEDFRWYVAENYKWENGINFSDGMTFYRDEKENCYQLKGEIKPVDIEKRKRLKKQIKNYVNLIDLRLPVPDSGDCWDCLFKNKEGKTMGDISKSNHLISHFEDEYLHGSILVNAMKEKGYSDSQIGFHYQMNLRDTFKRALRQYLSKRLLMN